MILFWKPLTGQKTIKRSIEENIGNDQGVCYVYLTSPDFAQLAMCSHWGKGRKKNELENQ